MRLRLLKPTQQIQLVAAAERLGQRVVLANQLITPGSTQFDQAVDKAAKFPLIAFHLMQAVLRGHLAVQFMQWTEQNPSYKSLFEYLPPQNPDLVRQAFTAAALWNFTPGIASSALDQVDDSAGWYDEKWIGKEIGELITHTLISTPKQHTAQQIEVGVVALRRLFFLHGLVARGSGTQFNFNTGLTHLLAIVNLVTRPNSEFQVTLDQKNAAPEASLFWVSPDKRSHLLLMGGEIPIQGYYSRPFKPDYSSRLWINPKNLFEDPTKDPTPATLRQVFPTFAGLVALLPAILPN